MTPDAQFIAVGRPEPDKLRLAIQHWVRVIIPFAASVLFMVLSVRLDSSRTAPNLGSL